MDPINLKSLEFTDLVAISARDFYLSIINYLPNLIGALAVFLIGWLIASAVKGALKHILKRIKFENYAQRGGLQKMLSKGGLSASTSEIITGITYWIVLLVFLIPSLRILGLLTVSDIFRDLLNYLPRVAAAVVVLSAGVFAARLIRDIISTAVGQIDVGHGKVAGSIAQTITVIFVIVLAASQLGIDTTIITANITVVIAGIMLAIGLSFGLGAKNVVGNLVASYYVRQLINKGDKIAVGDIKGKVEKIEATNVIVTTKSGRVTVPTKDFMEKSIQV